MLSAAGRWALRGGSGNAQTLWRRMGSHLPLPNCDEIDDGDASADDDNDGGWPDDDDDDDYD